LWLRTNISGRVCAWGNGGNGRLGQGDVADRTEVCLVHLGAGEAANSGGKSVEIRCRAVQCGASHSMVLTDKGAVYAWGKNTQGQCGQGHTEDILRPREISKLYTAIAAADASSAAASISDQSTNIVVQLAAGWEHSVALTAHGQLFSWGCGYKDRLEFLLLEQLDVLQYVSCVLIYVCKTW
jgi:alpha-tubulin suppressor-like RCC1 family protein